MSHSPVGATVPKLPPLRGLNQEDRWSPGLKPGVKNLSPYGALRDRFTFRLSRIETGQRRLVVHPMIRGELEASSRRRRDVAT